MEGSKEVLVPKQLTVSHPSQGYYSYVGWEPENYLLLSLFICIINPIMGPVAVFFSIMARRSFLRGDIVYTYKWGNYALFMSMMSIVASILFFISLGFSLSSIGRKGGYNW